MLLIIYQKSEDQQRVENLNTVLKGQWKLTADEVLQDFIYKKIGPPQNEHLLTQYFCEEPSERVPYVQDAQSMMEKFQSCQGHYEGYFSYNGEDIQEKFSLILLKPEKPRSNQYRLCGYGENRIGPYMLEGNI